MISLPKNCLLTSIDWGLPEPEFYPRERLTPLISMWQPWAQWIELGWKRVESRTHQRFASLLGRRIGIHISPYWDTNWLREAEPFLTPSQIGQTQDFQKEYRGVVRFTVMVDSARNLIA